MAERPPPTASAELAGLTRVAQAVGTAPDLQTFLAAACEEVARLVGADVVTYVRVDPARGLGWLLHAHGDAGALDGRQPIALQRDFAAGVGDFFVQQVEEYTGYERRIATGLGLATIATAPVVADERIIGALGVCWRERRPAEGCRGDVLVAVAAQFAAALEKHRLLDELRSRVDELSLLNEVGRSVAASLELDRILDEGVRALNRLLGTASANVLLVDRERRELRIATTSELPPEFRDVRMPLDGPSVAALAAREGRQFAVTDLRGSGLGEPRLMEAFDVRSVLAAPLLVRDTVLGVLMVLHQHEPRAFTASEVERITAVSIQMAVAIDNARLYQDLRRSYADLARAQDRVVRSERLAALGELSAVIAHEVRNPLGVIFNAIGALRRHVPARGDARKLVDMVGEEADRLNRMVGDLLDFARPPAPTLRPEPLDRVLDEAAAAALVEGAPGVEVERDVPGSLPLVPMDAALIRRAILNVVVNAVQAMPDGGVLTLRAAVADGEAVVEVGDSGPGIAAEARDRIFEPFFTTKPAGTGLGLAVVKRILDDHGGRIGVRTGPRGGTVFSLHLPAAAEPTPPAPAAHG